MAEGPFFLFVLPILLGLLGFVEPCTVGAHLLFLKALPRGAGRGRALGLFVLVRALVMGLIGAGFALIGQGLVGAQTAMWTLFGALYLLIGLGYLAGRRRILARRLSLAPGTWRHVRHPLVMGIGFGLNLPACAAPLVFALFAAGAATGRPEAGFVMLGLFGLALSLPLVALDRLRGRVPEVLLRRLPEPAAMRRVTGGVFVALGLWSLYFGLFVDPADWRFL